MKLKKTVKVKSRRQTSRNSTKKSKVRKSNKESTTFKTQSGQEWIIEDIEDDHKQDTPSAVDGDENDLDIDIIQDSKDDFLLEIGDDEDEDDFGANFSEQEEDDDPAKSLALVEAIQQISATKRRPVKRKEASQTVEEFVAIKKRVNVGDGGVNRFLESVKNAGELKAVEKVAKLVAATEVSKVSKKRHIKTLDAPAEKFISDKVKRTILYENTKEDVSKWNSIVYHNRVADQLVFPLKDEKASFRNPKKTKTEFMPVTPLEEEIAKVLYGDDYVARKKAELAKDAEKTDMESYLLSVEEAMATHSEIAKLRAMQSYAMAKSKRQNKIKSKKYHRLLRKTKIKQQMKEFEDLQKKDPEGAMLKLEELEKSRAEERMSLKHRNTSKWSKMHAARAKYNKDSRIALAEQLRLSKDLTKKVQHESSDEEDEMELPKLVKSSVENPVMLNPVNPDNFLKITKSGPSIEPQFNRENSKTLDLLRESDNSDDEDDQRKLIAEAFEDDDVVCEFQNKKSETIQASQPQDIDNFLPGWGSWTGKNITPNLKKRQKFVKKARKGPPRKDAHASHVIINEEDNEKVRSHQVKEVPFPFSRVKDFEKTLRAPIGRTWLPERAVKALTAPKVITKLGSTIKPISEDVLVKLKEKSLHVPSTIVRIAKVVSKK